MDESLKLQNRSTAFVVATVAALGILAWLMFGGLPASVRRTQRAGPLYPPTAQGVITAVNEMAIWAEGPAGLSTTTPQKIEVTLTPETKFLRGTADPASGEVAPRFTDRDFIARSDLKPGDKILVYVASRDFEDLLARPIDPATAIPFAEGAEQPRQKFVAEFVAVISQ